MSTRPPRPGDSVRRARAAAMRCLWVNLLVLPGAGSLKGGRRVGWLQLLLLTTGLLMLAPLALHAVDKALDAYRGVARMESSSDAEIEPAMDWRQARLQMSGILDQWGGLALGGMAVMMAAWGWALATSISLVVAAERDPAPRQGLF